MNRLLVLLFALLLSGCDGDQKQQFVACALEAGQHTSRRDVPANFPPPGSAAVEECMRAHGYELNQDQCPALRDDVIRPDPAALAALGEKLRQAYTDDTEKRLAALAAWRKAEPTCYEPTGWFAKRVLQIQKWRFRSREDAQIELIECAGFQSAMPANLGSAIYEELKRIGTPPVDIQAIPALANAYVSTYTVTKGRGAEVNARWDKGGTAAKKMGEQGDVRGIAKYLKSCTGTFLDAIGG